MRAVKQDVDGRDNPRIKSGDGHDGGPREGLRHDIIARSMAAPGRKRTLAMQTHIKHLAILVALGMPASAHVSDRGMDYSLYKDHAGAPCCDHTDCRPADDFVDER